MVTLSQAQDQGLEFRQMKSNAIGVNDHVPASCIYRITSIEREQVLSERVRTPRPAPKAILRSRKRVEQEQKQDADETFTDARKNWKCTQSLKSEEEMKTETLDEQWATSMLTLTFPT